MLLSPPPLPVQFSSLAPSPSLQPFPFLVTGDRRVNYRERRQEAGENRGERAHHRSREYSRGVGGLAGERSWKKKQLVERNGREREREGGATLGG